MKGMKTFDDTDGDWENCDWIHEWEVEEVNRGIFKLTHKSGLFAYSTERRLLLGKWNLSDLAYQARQLFEDKTSIAYLAEAKEAAT